MKRLFFILPVAGLLIAAAPVPVLTTPSENTLGVPLTVTVELPDEKAELAGLPSLSPFELLAPPRKVGNQLRMVLLPMRAGRHAIPSLPLHYGPSRQLATAPLVVTVSEGIPPDSQPAPLKRLPRTGNEQTAKLAALLFPFLLAPALLYLRHRRREKKEISPLEHGGEEALLAALSRELERLHIHGDKRWETLRRRLERLRFAPGERPEEKILEFLADFRKLAEKA